MRDTEKAITKVSASDISEKAKKMLDSKWKIEIYQLNVGQGDAALVKFINEYHPELSKNILIDGGPAGKGLKDKLEELLKGEKISAIILSHLDADHLFGLLEIEQLIKKGSIIFRPETKHSFNETKFREIESRLALKRITPEVGKSIWEYLDKDLFKRIEGSLLVFKKVGGKYEPNILESKVPNITFLGTDAMDIEQPEPKFTDGVNLEHYYGKLKAVFAKAREHNEVSIISLINFHKFNFYTAGDIYLEQEKRITEYFNKKNIVISARKFSHHLSGEVLYKELKGPNEGYTHYEYVPKVNFYKSHYANERSAAGIASYGKNKGGHPEEQHVQIIEETPTLAYAYATNPSSSRTVLGEKFIITTIPYILVKTDSKLAQSDKFLIEYGEKKEGEYIRKVQDFYIRNLKLDKLTQRLKAIERNAYLEITDKPSDVDFDDPLKIKDRLTLKIITIAKKVYEICLTKQVDRAIEYSKDAEKKFADFVFRLLIEEDDKGRTHGNEGIEDFRKIISFLKFLSGTNLPIDIIRDNALISKFIELPETKTETETEKLEGHRKILGILCDFAELFIDRIKIDGATIALQEKIQIRAARVGDREEPVEDVPAERGEGREDQELIDITKAYCEDGPFSGLRVYTEEEYKKLCKKAQHSRTELQKHSDKPDSPDKSEDRADHAPSTAEPSSKEKSQPQEERSETSKSESVSTKSTSRGASR